MFEEKKLKLLKAIVFVIKTVNDPTSVNNCFPRCQPRATCSPVSKKNILKSNRSAKITLVNHTEKFYELGTIKTSKQTTVVANVLRNCGTIVNYERFTTL